MTGTNGYKEQRSIDQSSHKRNRIKRALTRGSRPGFRDYLRLAQFEPSHPDAQVHTSGVSQVPLFKQGLEQRAKIQQRVCALHSSGEEEEIVWDYVQMSPASVVSVLSSEPSTYRFCNRILSSLLCICRLWDLSKNRSHTVLDKRLEQESAAIRNCGQGYLVRMIRISRTRCAI